MANEFEESGATAVEEIGFTLAAAVDFLAEMQSRGVDIDRAAASRVILICNWRELFLSNCQAPCLPRVVGAESWRVLAERRDCAKASIHARTSRWNKTIYDPHVNVLRATTEAMSAAIGRGRLDLCRAVR